MPPVTEQITLPLRKALPIVITVLLAWMFDAMDLMILAVTIKSISVSLGFDLKTVGALILSAALLTSGIGGILFGILADRIGRKKTLSLAILIYSIPTLFVGFVRTWEELLVLRLIAGFGVGGAWAAGMTLVAETVNPLERGTAVGIVQCGFPVGFTLAIVVSWFIGHTGNSTAECLFPNWRMCFIAAAIPALIMSAIVMLFIPESRIWLLHLHSSKVSLRDLVTNFTYAKLLLVAIAMDTLAMFSYWLWWVWLPTYLERAFALGAMKAAENVLWLLTTQIGAFVGYVLYGVIQDRLGRRPTWTIFTVGEGVMILLSILMISTIVSRGGIPEELLVPFYLTGFACGFFTGYWSGFGCILSELFPTKIRSTAAGFAFNIGRSINCVSPILVATLVIVTGSWELALVSGAIAAFGTASIVWILPETKGRDLTTMA